MLFSYLSEVEANLSDARKSLERAVKLFEKIVSAVPAVIRDYVDDVERLETERIAEERGAKLVIGKVVG